MVFREETLINVIRSVTRNGRSIILTALLALILVYLFSIVGFLFLKDDFIVEAEPRLPKIEDNTGMFCLELFAKLKRTRVRWVFVGFTQTALISQVCSYVYIMPF